MLSPFRWKQTDHAQPNQTRVSFTAAVALTGSVQPLNIYDRNGMKVVLHFGKDSPRDDVLVMVVSIMSVNETPVTKCTFQAAVPKVGRVTSLFSPSESQHKLLEQDLQCKLETIRVSNSQQSKRHEHLATKSLFGFHSSKWYIYFLKLHMICIVSP